MNDDLQGKTISAQTQTGNRMRNVKLNANNNNSNSNNNSNNNKTYTVGILCVIQGPRVVQAFCRGRKVRKYRHL